MNEPKPKLIPLRVPWWIYFTDTQFQMSITHKKDVLISCQVQWLPQNLTDKCEIAWKYQTVQMRFETQYEGAWILCEPDAFYTIQHSYDWSAIYPDDFPEPYEESNQLNPAYTIAHVEWRKQWVQAQICDNPMIYKVKDSRLVHEQGLEYWGDHFFIQLEDMNVNIVALNGYWKTKQNLEWHPFIFD